MKAKKIIQFFFYSVSVICIFANAQAQERPNILWLTFEDTSPQFIGCYGNETAETPVMDKMAAAGVRFTNAFSTGTVCSPSRSTIITGVRTFKMGTGNHRSNYPIPGFIHGFPYYLQEAGYYVTNNSKTDYNVGNGKAFTKEAWDESSNKAGWWNRKPGQPFFAVFNFMDSHQSRTMTWSYEKYEKQVLAELPKVNRPEQDKSDVKDEDQILNGAIPKAGTGGSPFMNVHKGGAISEDAFTVPPIYHDSKPMRKQLARVYNSIKLTDIKMGKLLNRLRDEGLMDNTIIFIFADHGEGIPRGKTNGIDFGYRVPFIAWFPEKYKKLSPWGTGGVVTDELIDFEDLAPTVISLADGKLPDYLKGRILMGKDRDKPNDHLELSSDRSDNGIDMVRSITNGRYTYSRNFMPFVPQMRYIRYMEIGEIMNQMRSDLAQGKLDSLQKSIFEKRPPEFLFDIENDPWETHNLAGDPKYAAILKKMRDQLETDIMDSHDVMFLPEYELGMISKTTTPYEFRLDKGKYPLREIYDAASLSGMRSVQTAKKQLDLLNSKNKIVRYWAVIGLRSQNAETLRPFKREIISAMKDAYPPVAVTASAIAYQNFGNTEAEDKLKKFCKSDNMDLALMAVNYLLYIDNKKPFIETIREVHDMPHRNYNVKAACMDFLGILKLVPNNIDNKI